MHWGFAAPGCSYQHAIHKRAEEAFHREWYSIESMSMDGMTPVNLNMARIKPLHAEWLIFRYFLYFQMYTGKLLKIFRYWFTLDNFLFYLFSHFCRISFMVSVNLVYKR